MSQSFFLRSINSDLSVGGALFNRKLLEDTATAASQEVSLSANQTLDAYAWTEPGIPGVGGGPGDYTVSIHVTSGATQINNSVRVARVNSSGTVQAESGFSTPDAGNAGVKVHEIPSVDLGTWAEGDRLRVQYRFVNTDSMMARSLTIELNTVETEVITPWEVGGDDLLKIVGESIQVGGEQEEQVVFSDDFSNTSKWIDDSFGGSNEFVAASNEGELRGVSNGTARIRADMPDREIHTIEWVRRGSWETSTQRRRTVAFRSDGTWLTSFDQDRPERGYAFIVSSTATPGVFHKMHPNFTFGFEQIGASFEFPSEEAANDPLRIKLQTETLTPTHVRIRLKWWADGTTEPGSWNIERDDEELGGEPVYTDGGVGMCLVGSGTGPRSLFISDLTVTEIVDEEVLYFIEGAPNLVLKIETESSQLSEAAPHYIGLIKVESEDNQISEADLRFLVSAVAELQLSGFRVDLEYTAFSGDQILRIENESIQTSEDDLTVMGIVKVEGETEEVNEVVLRLQSLIRMYSETTDISESDFKIVGLMRREDETLNTLETETTTLGKTRQEDEVTQVFETDQSVRGIFRMQGEALELPETDLYVRDLTRLVSESINTSEATFRFLELTRQVQEVVNLPESVLKFLALTRQEDETLNISELVVSQRGLSRQEDDSITVSEADLRFRGIFRIQDEGIDLSETDLSVRGIFRAESETLNISESTDRLLGLVRIEIDPLNLLESDLRFLALLRTESETTLLTEEDISALDLLRLVSETTNLIETDIAILTEFGVALIKVQDERVDVSELAISTRGFVRLEGETTSIAEQSQRLLGLLRLEQETTQVSESHFRFMALLRTEAETIEIIEEDLTLFDLLRLVSESTSISETDIAVLTEFGLALIKVVDEGIQISELDLQTLGLVHVESESTEISEAHQRLGALARIVSESSTLEESVLKLQSLTRVQSETATLPEGVIRALGLLKRMSESLSTTESTAFIRGLPARIISEGIQVTESTLRFVALAITGVLRKWRDFTTTKRSYNRKDRDYD